MREIFYAKGLAVDFYDRLYPGHLAGTSVEGDIHFYRAQARRVQGPILELGVGTGRVALPLAAAGHRIVGVDLSRWMLAAAARKAAALGLTDRITFVRQDMAKLRLGARRFPLALIPFRAFQHLLTPAAQRACLTAVRRHLRPRGRLIVDLFDPRLDYCVPTYTKGGGGGPKVEQYPDPARNRHLEIRYLSRANDPLRQVLTEVWEFREYGPKFRLRRRDRDHVHLRWTYRYEMQHLLELCGFRTVACYGDFRGGPPRYGKEQVWVAEKR